MIMSKNPESLTKREILLVLIIFIVSMTNFWIYSIYQTNFFLGEILIIETALLYLSILPHKNIALPILIYIILGVISLILLTNNFDKSLFLTSINDSIRIDHRRNYFYNDLGKIYANIGGIIYFNKLRLYFNNIQSNLFYPLDWSVYFSPTRLIDEGKYALLFGPFFIVGLIYLIGKNKKTIIIYFIISLLVNTFIKLDHKLEPLLLFPIVNICIGLGLIKFIEKLKTIFLK